VRIKCQNSWISIACADSSALMLLVVYQWFPNVYFRSNFWKLAAWRTSAMLYSVDRIAIGQRWSCGCCSSILCRICHGSDAAWTPFCMKWRHGRQLESVTSNRKSDPVSQCVFTWRSILPNFVPIWFETTDRVLSFFEDCHPNKNKNNKKNNKMSSDVGSVSDQKIEISNSSNSV